MIYHNFKIGYEKLMEKISSEFPNGSMLFKIYPKYNIEDVTYKVGEGYLIDSNKSNEVLKYISDGITECEEYIKNKYKSKYSGINGEVLIPDDEKLYMVIESDINEFFKKINCRLITGHNVIGDDVVYELYLDEREMDNKMDNVNRGQLLIDTSNLYDQVKVGNYDTSMIKGFTVQDKYKTVSEIVSNWIDSVGKKYIYGMIITKENLALITMNMNNYFNKLNVPIEAKSNPKSNNWVIELNIRESYPVEEKINMDIKYINVEINLDDLDLKTLLYIYDNLEDKMFEFDENESVKYNKLKLKHECFKSLYKIYENVFSENPCNGEITKGYFDRMHVVLSSTIDFRCPLLKVTKSYNIENLIGTMIIGGNKNE